MKKAVLLFLVAAALLFGASCSAYRGNAPADVSAEPAEPDDTETDGTSWPVTDPPTEPETEPPEKTDTLPSETESAPADDPGQKKTPRPQSDPRPGYTQSGGSTVDSYLGCTDNIASFLTAHLDEYLGTPYQGLFRNIDQPWVLLQYKGGGFADPHMNCAGFLSSVFQRCGGDIGLLPASSGAYANAYNWKVMAERADLLRYKFSTIEYALQSGLLQKGDLIYIHPVSFETGDCHIGFFWGDSPSDNKFLNALLRNDYTRERGYDRSGTMITPIMAESEYSYVLVIPVGH